MGILRSDRVSGLGGANAINGSVFFDGASIITVNDSDDFHYGTGDFTVEGWIYATGRDQQMMLLGQWDGNAGASDTVAWAVQLTNDTNGYLRFLTSTDTNNVVLNQNGTSGSVFDNAWHHFAVTRYGNDYKLFTDGAVVGSVTNSAAIGNVTIPLTIGGTSRQYTGGTAPNQIFTGYLSNIRITKGEAVYTAAFTAPTNRLEKTVNTVLLCCQSPGNILKEEVGKVLGVNVTNTNNKGPSASNFAPDLGEDHGTTFEDNTKFDTLSYMVPPGGTTEQGGRTSRGVFMGNGGVSPAVNIMDYINIQSTANSLDFGDATGNYAAGAAASSSTRGLHFAGFLSPAESNVIDYITIATTGNAADFGDLTQGRRNLNAFSSQTRGIAAGGTTQSPAVKQNVIDYVTIATLGNATDFGDLQNPVSSDPTGFSSPTRGIIAGGEANSPLNNGVDVIDYVTIASTGDATDFGNLTAVQSRGDGTSSNIRGVIYSGKRHPTSYSNTIDYITIATTGNAKDFGDAETAINNIAATSNCLRGVFGGGYVPGANTNAISYMSLQSSGNSLSFGDLTVARREFAACSDSHGGLS